MAERAAELGHLDDLLAGVRHGRPRFVLVDGSIGTGKTALLRTFAEHAIDAGAVVLTAVSSRKESTVGMGVIGQLFRGAQLPRSISECGHTDRLADLRLFARDLTAKVADGLTPTSILDQVFSVLDELASAGPVVIEIDDVHCADDASLECLQYLLRRLWRARVLIVLTESGHERPPNRSLLVELLRLPGFRRLKLGLLSAERVELMLTPDLGAAQARARATRYHAITGGNPLLVRALLDDHARSAPDTDEDADLLVGNSYGHAVLVILHSGPESVLLVARALAVLGADSSPETVQRVLGMDRTTVVQAIERLVEAGLVVPELAISGTCTDNPFRHARALAAVFADIPAEDRSRLHGSAADLLHELGAPATAIAPLLLADGHVKGASASEILRIAAEQALHDDQPDLAVAFLRCAEKTACDENQRLAVSFLLFQAEWQIDPALSSTAFDPLLAAMRAGGLPWRDAVFLAKSLLWHGRCDDAKEVIGFLVRKSSRNPDADAGLSVLWDWLSTVYPDLLGTIDRPKPAAIPARGPSLRSQSMSLFSSVLATGGGHETVVQAEEILCALETGGGIPESVEAALLALVYTDCPDRAARWCDHLLAQATARHVPTWFATLSAIRAEAAVRQGNLPVAKKHGRAALTAVRPRGWGVALAMPVASLIFAATGMGMYSEAATLLSQPMPEEVFRTRYGLHYLHARGHYHFMTGRSGAAVEDFLLCGDLMARWGIDLPTLVPWRSAAAAALVALEKHDQARKLAEEQLRSPGAQQCRGRGMALRVLAKVGEPDRRPTLLHRAVTELRNSADRLELAYALAELGAAHHEAGETESARSFTAQALRLASECNVMPLREHIVEQLGEAAGRRRGENPGQGDVTTLSPAEFRVAALAAHGYTNRTIATKLRITASTVEQHLTRVYRKLKVSRRAELPVSLLTLT